MKKVTLFFWESIIFTPTLVILVWPFFNSGLTCGSILYEGNTFRRCWPVFIDYSFSCCVWAKAWADFGWRRWNEEGRWPKRFFLRLIKMSWHFTEKKFSMIYFVSLSTDAGREESRFIKLMMAIATRSCQRLTSADQRPGVASVCL